MALPDYLDLPDLDAVFRTVLDGEGSASAFMSTAKNSAAFAVRRVRRSGAISGCGRGKPFSTPVERSICGKGSLDCWTSQRERTAMTCRYA
jgi:hypothetical protein